MPSFLGFVNFIDSSVGSLFTLCYDLMIMWKRPKLMEHSSRWKDIDYVWGTSKKTSWKGLDLIWLFRICRIPIIGLNVNNNLQRVIYSGRDINVLSNKFTSNCFLFCLDNCHFWILLPSYTREKPNVFNVGFHWDLVKKMASHLKRRLIMLFKKFAELIKTLPLFDQSFSCWIFSIFCHPFSILFLTVDKGIIMRFEGKLSMLGE